MTMRVLNSIIGAFVGVVLAAMFSDGIYRLIWPAPYTLRGKVFFFYFIVAPICIITGIIVGARASKKR